MTEQNFHYITRELFIDAGAKTGWETFVVSSSVGPSEETELRGVHTDVFTNIDDMLGHPVEGWILWSDEEIAEAYTSQAALPEDPEGYYGSIDVWNINEGDDDDGDDGADWWKS